MARQGPVVSVPSGNFGNLTAGLIAKRIGLPIRAVRGRHQRQRRRARVSGVRASTSRAHRFATVANAMDVGAPSNFERVQALYNSDLDGAAPGRRRVSPTSDARSSPRLGMSIGEHGYVLDPHSAIAWLALQDRARQDQPDARGVFLATAHPAKFREVVEPAIGRSRSPLPPALADAISRPRHSISMPADYAALEDFLRATQAPSARTYEPSRERARVQTR